jgi:hypothetical protein
MSQTYLEGHPIHEMADSTTCWALVPTARIDIDTKSVKVTRRGLCRYSNLVGKRCHTRFRFRALHSASRTKPSAAHPIMWSVMLDSQKSWSTALPCLSS